MLSRYGLDQGSTDTSREALRCLANAFLLNEPCRQIFVDLGYAPKAADRLKVDSRHDEFLVSRILFLLTYNTRLDMEALVNDRQLAESINQQIARHAKNVSQSRQRNPDSATMPEMAMVETLKLLFNITYHYPHLIPKFNPSIDPLVHIFVHHPLPNPPLQSPITNLLNALLNLDLKSAEEKNPTPDERKTTPLLPYANPEQVVDRLISIFDKAIRSQPEHELDQAAAPLCTLIRRFYELATPQVKSFMRSSLLPRDSDRDRPLGQNESMPSRLLRLSCSPSLPTLRENISSLLFELSDKDATKFVKNIGYGFAAGFLLSHNIQIAPNAAESSSASNDGDASNDAGINPVTGQRLTAEHIDESKAMTEEEKEREAERLFVLFERLRATGVVDVKNPIQQAVEEGRFEELPD